MARLALFENETADGNKAVLSGARSAKFNIAVIGTFDGACVTIEASCDGGTTWTAIKDVSGNTVEIKDVTQDEYVEYLAPDFAVRGVISGAGASTDITAYIVG